MRRIVSTTLLTLLGVLLIISLTYARPDGRPAAVAPASAGGNYTLDWSTIDGGGGTSNSGSLAISGTVGQPDPASASGGAYTLSGGFWPGAQPDYRLRLPLLKR
jgi:hypothetical protein